VGIDNNSLPQRRRGTRIDGNISYKPPGGSQISQDPGLKLQIGV